MERFVLAAYHIGAEHVESCGTRKLSDFPDGRKIPVSGGEIVAQSTDVS